VISLEKKMQPGNAETIFVQGVADVIIKYGFLAVGLVLIVIVPPITIMWAKSRSIAYASFWAGLAFLTTYGLLSIVEQYFPWLLISKNPVLFGMVREVPNGFKVQVRENERGVKVYLNRQYHPDNVSLFNEFFVLSPVYHPKCLAIIIDSTDPNKEQVFSYNIDGLELSDVISMKELILHATRSSDGSILLTGRREKNGLHVPPPLKVEQRTGEEKLCNDDNQDQAANQVSDLFGYIFGVAYAADHGPTPAPPGTHPPAPSPKPLTLENIRPRLQNDDAFVRRDARSDLARLGAGAGPVVSQLLSSGNYRLELGGLAAIAEMPKEQRAGLSDEVKRQVESHTNSSDPTMRETALRALSGF
jgi:hypothetical protein